MRGYDWGFGFGFGERYSARRRTYDAGFSRRGYDRSGRGGGYGDAPPRAGRYDQPRSGGGRGYDRGIYGEDYPVFGGVPGGRDRGMYYGGRGRYDRPFTPRPERSQGERPGWGGGGWGAGGGARFERGYGQEYATEPFLPEHAYARHPALERESSHRFSRWPGGGRWAGYDVGLDDEEIEQAVRQNLYQDNWIDADAIEVEVSDGVVTLSGEVRDFIEARYAWDDAWETDGVHGVVNQLTVRVDQPSSPAATDTESSDAAAPTARPGGEATRPDDAE